jgi:hypothetical protein
VLVVVTRQALEAGLMPNDIAKALDIAKENERGESSDSLWEKYTREMAERRASGKQPLTPEVLAFLNVPNPSIKTDSGRMSLHKFLSLSEAKFEEAGGDSVDWRSAVGNPWLARNLGLMRKSGNMDDYGLERAGGKKEPAGLSIEEIMASLQNPPA